MKQYHLQAPSDRTKEEFTLDQRTIQETVGKLEESIAKIEEKYRNGAHKEASKEIPEFFETLLYSLTVLAGIPDSGNSDFQVTAINTLYTEKWITDNEKNKLHKLRKIRNAFEHQFKIDHGNDPEAQAELQRYRENFAQIIEWCRKDIEMFRNIAERISDGRHVENSSDQQIIENDVLYTGYREPYEGQRQTAPERTGREATWLEKTFFMRVYIPIILASVLSVLFGLMYDMSELAEIAEQHHINLDAVSSEWALIGIYAVVVLLFIFLYHITPHFTCGTVMFILARNATGSVRCAVLLAVMSVLLAARFSYQLKTAITYVFYGFWILIYLFSVPSVIRSHLGDNEPLDLYTVLVRYAPPMLLYVLIFVVAAFIIKRRNIARPFSLSLSEVMIHVRPLHLSVGLILVLLAAAAWLYRDTWMHALILRTRDFYASPSAFWTVHLVMTAILFYILGNRKRKRCFQNLTLNVELTREDP